MNSELFMVFVPGVSAILFALGGTQISEKIKGMKVFRRFILPAFYGFAAAIVCAWYQAVLIAVLACVAFSLGYGEGSKWLKRLFIFALYGLISAPVGLSAWNLITFISVIILFILSNLKISEHIVLWKIVEACIGMLAGIQLAYVLMGRGLLWL